MSTKIYVAYRLHADKFPQFLESYREYCFKNIAKKIRQRLGKNRRDPQAVREYLKTCMKDAELSEIDYSISIWFYKKHAYVIAHGDCWMPEYKNRYAKDYCYWNNADRPKNVSDKEWKSRWRTWRKVCLQDWHQGRLSHKIIEAKSRVGLYELITLLVGKKNLVFANP